MLTYDCVSRRTIPSKRSETVDVRRKLVLTSLPQYVGGTANTIPFDGAPSAVIKARDLIQSRMMGVMPAESQPYRFNEVLSAAYMEEQKMAVSAMSLVLSSLRVGCRQSSGN